MGEMSGCHDPGKINVIESSHFFNITGLYSIPCYLMHGINTTVGCVYCARSAWGEGYSVVNVI